MRLAILGAGDFGRTIKDVAEQTGKYSEIILLDDSSTEGVSGTLESFTDYIDDETEFYPAIGDNKLRYCWILKIDNAKAKVATIIHPSAYISPTAIIGIGCAILPNATVNTNAALSYASIINIGGIVDHDVFLGTGVHVAPGAIVKGENLIPSFTKVESGTVIETGEFPIDK